MDKPEGDGDWDESASGAALDSSGRLERTARSRPTAPAPSTTPTQADADVPGVTGLADAADDSSPQFLSHQGPLELAHDPRSPPSEQQPEATHPFGETVAPKRGRRTAAISILVLAAALTAAWFALPQLRNLVAGVLPGSRTKVLQISSEPSGATIVIAGQTVGQTPYVGDNIWPDRPIDISLRLSGYEPWRGEFRGGREQTLSVTLRKRAGRGD